MKQGHATEDEKGGCPMTALSGNDIPLFGTVQRSSKPKVIKGQLEALVKETNN